MGGGPPASLEVFRSCQEVIGLEAFFDALANGHPAEDHSNPADTRRMEGMIESFLQRVNDTVVYESELTGPNHAIHFQVIETKPATSQNGGRDILVESSHSGVIKQTWLSLRDPPSLMQSKKAFQVLREVFLTASSKKSNREILEQLVSPVPEGRSELRVERSQVSLIVVGEGYQRAGFDLPVGAPGVPTREQLLEQLRQDSPLAEATKIRQRPVVSQCLHEPRYEPLSVSRPHEHAEIF